MNQEVKETPREDTSTSETPKPVKLTLPEKILTVVGLIVVVSWIVIWSQSGPRHFDYWFSLPSFLGSLGIIAFVVARKAGVLTLPEKLGALALPILSLVPLAGYLISRLKDFWVFLAEAGTIALAYVAATTYWRKHIPDVVANPAGKGKEEEPAEPSTEPPAPSEEPEKVEQ